MSTPPEIAILSERVSTMQSTVNELRDTVNRMVESQASMQVLSNDLSHVWSAIDRAFVAIEKLANVTNSNARVITQHSTKLRIATAIIAASAGLVGWGWNTIDALHRNTTSLDTRVAFVERAQHVQSAQK